MTMVKKRAWIFILLAGILWGTSGLFVHWLTPFGFSALQMAAMRGSVAALTMSGYVCYQNRSLFRLGKGEFWLFLGSGAAMFLTGSCYYASMQMTSVSTAVVLMYTAPIFVMAFSVAYLGESLTSLKGMAVGMMLIGCGLVSGIVGGLRFHMLGIGVGLLSGIAYSAYNILTKIQMRRKSNPISATLYCFIFMAIFALSVANPMEMVQLTMQKPAVILPLMVGVGVCTSVLPYFLYTLALKEIPVGTASTLSIVEPMAATLMSVWFLGEKIGIFSLCGIVLILGAVFLLGKSEK
ncbi:MAG: DMT family transporter [Clostridia bacterium]|nr:DMT family transporter [Clostridia bacterium]